MPSHTSLGDRVHSIIKVHNDQPTRSSRSRKQEIDRRKLDEGRRESEQFLNCSWSEDKARGDHTTSCGSADGLDGAACGEVDRAGNGACTWSDDAADVDGG